MYMFIYVYVYTCACKLPLKAGFDAAILCRVAVTSSAFIFLTLFKNSVVMLFSYAVSKEPKFWGSSSLTGKNCLADWPLEQSTEGKYWFLVKEDSEEPSLLISLNRAFQKSISSLAQQHCWYGSHLTVLCFQTTKSQKCCPVTENPGETRMGRQVKAISNMLTKTE